MEKCTEKILFEFWYVWFVGGVYNKAGEKILSEMENIHLQSKWKVKIDVEGLFCLGVIWSFCLSFFSTFYLGQDFKKLEAILKQKFKRTLKKPKPLTGKWSNSALQEESF